MSYENGMVKEKGFFSTNSSDPDIELIREISKGNQHSLEVLYSRHGVALFAYLMARIENQQLAEEVLQDVMMAVWKSAHRFRGDSKVRTWLLSICRYKAINARQRRRQPHTISLENAPIKEMISIQQSSMLDDQHDELRAAIHKLPDQQREVLELIFFHNLSGQEAAQVLGVATGTIKSRLHRAKASLRTQFSPEEDSNV